MTFGSSLEPPSAEGRAASVQSEARARGRQSDALSTRIAAAAAGRVRVLTVECSQEMAASFFIPLVTKISENAADLMRGARDLGVDQSLRMLAKVSPKVARQG